MSKFSGTSEYRFAKVTQVAAGAKGAPSVWERPVYQPPRDTPRRAGSEDASRIPSLGGTAASYLDRRHA